MLKLNILFCLLIFIFACSDHVNNKAENTSETSDYFPPELVEKANIKVNPIDQLTFETVTYLDTLSSIANLCYLSKGYQSQIWEGLNRCDWAIEKERLKAAGDLVRREEASLKIYKEDSVLELINSSNQRGDSIYYQFKKYIPHTGFFIVEKSEMTDCDKSMLFHAKSNIEYTLKGNIHFLKNPNQFILSSTPGSNPKCQSKLEYYEIKDSALIKQWHLPLQAKVIENLKVGIDNNLYCAIAEKNKVETPTQFLAGTA